MRPVTRNMTSSNVKGIDLAGIGAPRRKRANSSAVSVTYPLRASQFICESKHSGEILSDPCDSETWWHISTGSERANDSVDGFVYYEIQNFRSGYQVEIKTSLLMIFGKSTTEIYYVLLILMKRTGEC
jgi:hypothetical protein